ncbi:MAG: recombinase family protein [Novosphingobium sp.]|nr:recombinase family protein [Novosphingobium sp.]MCP5400934.1 recombinase family protein [Novosphingobium sp.]
MSKVRCAIYTRKSSEEGLEQDFNSLDAQREACAAYILSQASEGWSLLPEYYDDGGLSGGTLERPALKRLLTDIEAGKIDIVVVYKVDRLTRSLLDFAKLVETFDVAGTSFVSVTQSFNTTNSMGRLTLNMLLSFAQFEREVTAERIRDKIAASKAKGMWMGGNPPLGYKPDDRSLAIVPEHADLIRQLFRRYLAIGNVRLLVEQLEAEGTRVPIRTASTGRRMGGGTFGRGQLYAILSNPIYLGEIHHRGKVYEGKHEAIITRDLWDQVQARLADNTQGRQRTSTARSPSLLAGLVFDENGEPLVATHASKHMSNSARGGKTRYRYYVSRSLQLGSEKEGCGIRMPAQALEEIVCETLAKQFDQPLRLISQAGLEAQPSQLEQVTLACKKAAIELRQGSSPVLGQLISRVELGYGEITVKVGTSELAAHLDIAKAAAAPELLCLTIEVQLRRSGKIVRFVEPGGKPFCDSEPQPHLVKLLKLSQAWWREMQDDHLSAKELSIRHSVDKSYVSRVIRLNFLAPKIIEQMLAGEQTADLDVRTLLGLTALPLRWEEQEHLFLAR